MNIQIFGTSKCFDTKKAQRYFKAGASLRTWPARWAAGSSW